MLNYGKRLSIKEDILQGISVRIAMNKTIMVFRNELIRTITRPSFIISLLIFPFIMAVVIFVTSTQEDPTSSAAITALTGDTGELHEGYVDLSGLIKALPPEVEEGSLTCFPGYRQCKPGN